MKSFLVKAFIYIFFSLSLNAQSEIEFNLDSVVVSAARIPSNFSEIGRTISIITNKERI